MCHYLFEGHEAGYSYLESKVADFLLQTTNLNHHSQAVLLDKGEEVFTDTGNIMLEKLPTKDEIKEVIHNSNLNAASGRDGITALLYHEDWNIKGGTKVTM